MDSPEEKARQAFESAFAPLKCVATVSAAGNRLSFRVYVVDQLVLRMDNLLPAQFLDEARRAKILRHAQRRLAVRGLLPVAKKSH